MSRQYRIRVYGKQRKDIDPALLAQVVILFGRHLQQQQQQNHHATEDATAGKNPSASRRRNKPVVISPAEEDTAPRAPREGEGDNPGEGRGVQ
jgi:hypothetical protein